MKLSIHDPIEKWERTIVLLDNRVINFVLSADEEKGEVIVQKVDNEGYIQSEKGKLKVTTLYGKVKIILPK